MATLTLVDEMLGLQTLPTAHNSLADFVTSVDASNGMLIPFEVLVQARLSDRPDAAHARLLKREYQHKSALLDADRQIAACMCTIVASAPDDSSQAEGALATCIESLAPSTVARVLHFALGPSHTAVVALLSQSEPAELLMEVEIGTAVRRAAPLLRELRRHLHGHPLTRLVAVMRDSRREDSAKSLPDAGALLEELAATTDLIFLLPLVTDADPPRNITRHQRYCEITALLAELSLIRHAPGLFGPAPANPVARVALPWLHRIMTDLPQFDVLGLGPAAHSRFDEVCFENHAGLPSYAHDLKRGGFAIARSFGAQPVNHFVNAVIIKLASGSAVDLLATAARCRCASPSFLEACNRTVDVLRANGAVSGRDARRVSLTAANDSRFAEVQSQLARLRVAAPAVLLPSGR